MYAGLGYRIHFEASRSDFCVHFGIFLVFICVCGPLRYGVDFLCDKTVKQTAVRQSAWAQGNSRGVMFT